MQLRSNMKRLIIITGSIVSVETNAEQFFNPALLSGDTLSVVDLSRYEKGASQPPGQYRVDIYINSIFTEIRDVIFVDQDEKRHFKDSSGLVPCFSLKWLKQQGVHIPVNEVFDNENCINLEDIIQDAKTSFDFTKQQLDISIPQASLSNHARGYIPPEYWEEGIPSWLVNYRFTGNNNKNKNKDNDSYYLNVLNGVNIGLWRFRNEGAWSYNKSTKGATNKGWKNIRSYAERPIAKIKSNLTLGDSFTGNQLFESYGFRGISLASDDKMLPDSLRGFSPVVRGIANSNAVVTIEQNGYVVYQTNVSPGPFEINDLYPTSSSGDLVVTVKESNGKINKFTVPYSSVPNLQREGRANYKITVGEYRSGSFTHKKPRFIQAEFLYGLTQGWTFYQGALAAERYNSIAVGFARNLGIFGAISADITRANSKLPNGNDSSGQALRFLYAKSLNSAGTNFQLLGYRYSTKGFYSFPETTYRNMNGYYSREEDDPSFVEGYNLHFTKKGRVDANISQQLGDYGTIYFLTSYQNYWNTNRKDELYQLGYSTSWNGISLNINTSLDKNAWVDGKKDKRLSISMSVPLNHFWGRQGVMGDITSSLNTAYATYSLNHSDDEMTNQVGISGTLLSKNNLNYNVQQGYTNKGQGASGNASLDYHGGYGNLNANYGYGKNWHQYGYEMSGGIVIHENGLTLSQPLGETNVLVKAPGANNVYIENEVGIKTDFRGYAIIPYATPYRINRIALDTNTLPNNVDVDVAVTSVVPTQGALIRANFDTSIGQRALILLRKSNGDPIPFGSTVFNKDQTISGIVGDDGQVYLSGLPNAGELIVSWGAESSQTCKGNYLLSAPVDMSGIQKFELSCK